MRAPPVYVPPKPKRKWYWVDAAIVGGVYIGILLALLVPIHRRDLLGDYLTVMFGAPALTLLLWLMYPLATRRK